MTDFPVPQSVAAAREQLAIDLSVPVRSYHVRRLDQPGKAYHLLTFGSPDGTVGVATIDATTGALESSARLPGTQPQLPVSAVEAKTLAGLGDSASAQLVWLPSAASRSPFLPIWEVRGPDGTVRHVDQGRRIVPPASLIKPGGPG